MRTTYNTGKVRIGLAYVPRPMPVIGDAFHIQTALLFPAKRKSFLQRVAGFIWRWL